MKDMVIIISWIEAYVYLEEHKELHYPSGVKNIFDERFVSWLKDSLKLNEETVDRILETAKHYDNELVYSAMDWMTDELVKRSQRAWN